MNIQNGGDDGIRGSGVDGFNLTSVNMTSNGNAVGERGDFEMNRLHSWIVPAQRQHPRRNGRRSRGNTINDPERNVISIETGPAPSAT